MCAHLGPDFGVFSTFVVFCFVLSSFFRVPPRLKRRQVCCRAGRRNHAWSRGWDHVDLTRGWWNLWGYHPNGGLHHDTWWFLMGTRKFLGECWVVASQHAHWNDENWLMVYIPKWPKFPGELRYFGIVIPYRNSPNSVELQTVLNCYNSSWLLPI